MRIVVVSVYREKDFKSRLHLSFLGRLREYCDGYYVYDRNKIVDPRLRNLKIPIMSIYKKHRPDLFICYGHDIFFRWGDCFKKVPCKKMMIEVDYRKMTGRSPWYKNNGFGIIVQRGAYKNNKTGIPMVWLPFSVDPEEFYPDPEIVRENKIGFVGSYMSKAYKQRKKAISVLKKNKLLHMSNKKIKIPQKYAEFVRSTVGFLGSAEYHTPHGKVFEVMASGTTLLCPQFKHDRILFGKEQCYVPYHPSCNNVVTQAKKIINNNEWAKKIAENSREAVLKSHTHELRIQELWEIIERFMKGNSQPRKWGI